MTRAVETIDLTATTVLLQQWAEWMRSSKATEGMGYPERAAVCASTAGMDWQDLEDATDAWRIHCCDTVMDDLLQQEPILHMALSNRYLDAVYTFPRGNYPDLLVDAHLQVRLRLLRKDVVV